MATVLEARMWDNQNAAPGDGTPKGPLTTTRYQREEAGMKATHCSIEGCTGAHVGRGWCLKHYTRWRRHGDPLATQFRDGPLRPWFESRMDKSDPDGCWPWLGRTHTRKDFTYGALDVDGDETLAHIVSHNLFVGPVPKGMYVDHRCHNTVCVRPDHLRAVTPGQNMQNRAGATKRSKTGVRGVSLHRNSFVVWAQANYERHYGGTFTNLVDAEQAAIALRNTLFTHNDVDRRESA